jgi:uncharacterized metal-binding protein
MTAKPPELIDVEKSAAPDQRPSRPPVIYACSGCSDAGELADRTARTLAQLKLGEMSCLAGVGGKVKSLLNKAQTAEQILVIDGCALNCARHTLELAGITGFKHLELHHLGFRKGACPVTPERIAAAVEAGSNLIHASNVEESK